MNAREYRIERDNARSQLAIALKRLALFRGAMTEIAVNTSDDYVRQKLKWVQENEESA